MSKAPKLRFKEFSGDWESEKLGNLLEFKNGINASKEQYGHGKKFINVLDILNNNYITYENIIGKVDVDEDTFEKYSVGYGDIVFQRSSETREEVGTANVYLDKEQKATFGGFIIRGKKVGEYNPIFMNKLLKTSSARKEITTKAGGSTRYNVGQDTLSDVEVMLPKLEEQEKIASFFSLIDDKISLQGEKVEALRDYKKGMMQKIFSRELRFKNDEGRDYSEWEEKKLGQIADIYQPQTISQQDFTISGYKVYGANGIIGFYSKYNHETEQIAITCRGNTCGTVNITERKSWITGNAMVVNVDEYLENVNKYFLGFLLDYSNLKYMITGSGQPQITRDVVSSHKIKLPCLSEQNKISRLLLKIDMKLNKEQEKLDSLKQYKKGLLQQMFV